MRYIVLTICFLIITVSCATISTDYLYDKTEKGNLYFPSADETIYKRDTINTLPNDSLRNFTNKWYSKHLYTLNESIIYSDRNPQKQIIRFTHLGTWSHPFSYKIEKVDTKYILSYSETDGLGGYKSGKLIKHRVKEIPANIWKGIIAKVDSIDFWKIPTHNSTLILDGEEWILEILIDGRYHFVTRKSPDLHDDQEFTILCKMISQSK